MAPGKPHRGNDLSPRPRVVRPTAGRQYNQHLCHVLSVHNIYYSWLIHRRERQTFWEIECRTSGSLEHGIPGRRRQRPPAVAMLHAPTKGRDRYLGPGKKWSMLEEGFSSITRIRRIRVLVLWLWRKRPCQPPCCRGIQYANPEAFAVLTIIVRAVAAGIRREAPAV